MYIILFLSLLSSCLTTMTVNCPLKWEAASADTKLPNFAIYSQKESHIVISAKTSSGADEIGRLEYNGGDLSVGLVPNTTSSEAVPLFAVLTNSLGCQINWVDKQDPRISRNGVILNGKLVGRVMSAGSLLPCSISGNTAVYIGTDNSRQTTSDYSVLISYNTGLILTLKDFDFGDMTYGSDDVFGYDELINHADVDVIYSVTHSKTTTDTVSITESHSTTKSWHLSAQVNCKMNFKIKAVEGSVGGGIGVDFSKSSESGWGSSMTHSQTRKIAITRSVFVPPRTSIVACSTSKSVENVQVSYTCLAEYKSPGLNGTQVLEYVQETFPNAKTIGDSVVVEIDGTFQGSLSLSTSFIVKPHDAFVSCTNGM